MLYFLFANRILFKWKRAGRNAVTESIWFLSKLTLNSCCKSMKSTFRESINIDVLFISYVSYFNIITFYLLCKTCFVKFNVNSHLLMIFKLLFWFRVWNNISVDSKSIFLNREFVHSSCNVTFTKLCKFQVFSIFCCETKNISFS